MRNTNRTLENIPPSLDDLENLRDIDLAENNLPAIPEALFKLKNLRKLDISGNKVLFWSLSMYGIIENLTVFKIEKITIPEGSWEMLETLNISGNGIPSGIGKLVQLIVLHLTRNNLELVPEGITRCVRLQRLRLNHNRLITLPDGIHLLPDLKELDLTDNDDLVMPPKPNEARKKLAFYNIDFSLEHQRTLAGQSPSSSISSLQSTTKEKDPVARRKDFIRRRKQQTDQEDASKVIQDEESMMFRSKFAGWDDIVPVDFTRTSESVLVKRDNMMRTDLTALFLDRQPAMPPEESEELLNDCNEDLEFIESFVLEGKKFVRLPDGEFGSFYTMDCYVFLCRYAVIPDESEDESDAGDVEVVRMHQQQENHKFLSHFHRKFVIRRGRRGLTRNLGGKWPELFQMRANGSSVCTRTIQIDCRATELCSGFCHILRAPFKVQREDGEKGIVYVWIGTQSDPHEHEYARRDDLDDDDIMILDNGELVFLWLGARASEVEVKLAYKAATVYVAHLRMRQTDRPRTLKLAIKGKESKRFKKCFHAWGRHKVGSLRRYNFLRFYEDL
ncbi:leucine Rich repeat-containing domain protein [Teladorsagia circumcincta]|uniref:Leucine Rich repeat-containing domain protein n=1 Tax=Teladorsagia circumcincta TaxID=45464 RepID=A0A2G9U2Y3_TELCI|nr:leucine Rich repeat-containing domain protein [Teladorsagia circumcincta]